MSAQTVTVELTIRQARALEHAASLMAQVVPGLREHLTAEQGESALETAMGRLASAIERNEITA